MPHDVFISHAAKDKAAADAACATLEAAGIRCWIAPRDVQPGRSFAGEITRAIQGSKAMVLIFSAHTNNSEQVLREVQLAVNAHLHILQFRIEEVLLNDDLKYYLSTPHWLDALTPPLEDHLSRLRTSIKTLLNVSAEKPGEIVAPPAAPPPSIPRAAEPDRLIPDVTKPASTWISTRNAAIALAAVLICFAIAAFLLLARSHAPKKVEAVSSSQQPSSSNPSRDFKNLWSKPRATPAPAVAENHSPNHESAMAYNKNGIKKTQMGDFAGALADYDHAIELDPKFVAAYNDRAGAKENKGDLTGALADCGRAIEIDPNYALAYFHRGCIQYGIGNFRAAIGDFYHASKISPKPDYSRLYVWLAQMHLGQKEQADRELADYFGERTKASEQDRPGTIAAFLLDKLTLAEFLPLESPSGPKRGIPQPEALFFAGMKSLFTGDKSRAAKFFRSSIEAGVHPVQSRFAEAELKALGQ
jgi:lipoprotein NlpI